MYNFHNKKPGCCDHFNPYTGINLANQYGMESGLKQETEARLKARIFNDFMKNGRMACKLYFCGADFNASYFKFDYVKICLNYSPNKADSKKDPENMVKFIRESLGAPSESCFLFQKWSNVYVIVLKPYVYYILNMVYIHNAELANFKIITPLFWDAARSIIKYQGGLYMAAILNTTMKLNLIEKVRLPIVDPILSKIEYSSCVTILLKEECKSVGEAKIIMKLIRDIFIFWDLAKEISLVEETLIVKQFKIIIPSPLIKCFTDYLSDTALRCFEA